MWTSQGSILNKVYTWFHDPGQLLEAKPVTSAFPGSDARLAAQDCDFILRCWKGGVLVVAGTVGSSLLSAAAKSSSLSVLETRAHEWLIAGNLQPTAEPLGFSHVPCSSGKGALSK